ncbi:Fatty aldehyde dehydrogenase isoform 3 [Schistosoma japonicum]|nr:Fatty aldehyde dehydrogenase [Schistosoma japonicum]TNN20906.1 Fatty aldehyde dehydrogenase isoform 3 [Schistosoma japonicum]
MADVDTSVGEAKIMLSSADLWLQEESVPASFITLLDKVTIQRQPYGVVLIISPWNFPFVLAFQPLIGAIAAGNTVLLKPSEMTPACSQLISGLIPKYLDESICQVICGDGGVCKQILETQRFDFIFYTGGTTIGREVYVAAAKQLTPIVLELGGKCPVYIDSDVSLDVAVKRIVYSKLLNCGQICVAADYVLCHEKIVSVFKEKVEETIMQFLGDNPQNSPDYARIINVRHFQRLTGLLKQTKGKVVIGGMSDANDNYIAPTVVLDIDEEDILMQDEIFGPILPVLSVKSPSDAIRIINSKEKPLAIYVFTRNKSLFNDFKMATSSGAIMMNDCSVHFLIPNIPFGGVGHSGIGNYHGRYSIETFSHRRPVILKSEIEYINNKIRYYPYTESGLSWLRWSLKKPDRNGCHIL